MKNICIIGVGNLGYRHYQALLKINFDAAIYLVDPNITAVEPTIKNTEYSNPKVKKVCLLTGIGELPVDIDLVIIATNSDVRSAVTKQLVESKSVLYILFEKVLFQKISEYQEINDLISQHGIKAWVNCPLRMYPYYQEIKKDIDNKPVSCRVTGWDIACNTIHFVDLVEWLTGGKLGRVVTEKLSNSIIESKRKGFIEFTGELYCEFSGGSALSMNVTPGGEQERNIEIITDNVQYELDEIKKRCRKMQGDQITEYEIRPLYQSELTNMVAKNIILQKQCELVSYCDSMHQHVKIVEAFKKYVEHINSEYIVDGGVPVT